MGRKKEYKDLLDKEVKIGDKVLHLWTYVDTKGYPHGGKGAIKCKIATVVKFTPSGIQIKYIKDGTECKSVVRNIKNRILVLTKNNELIIDREKELATILIIATLKKERDKEMGEKIKATQEKNRIEKKMKDYY